MVLVTDQIQLDLTTAYITSTFSFLTRYQPKVTMKPMQIVVNVLDGFFLENNFLRLDTFTAEKLLGLVVNDGNNFKIYDVRKFYIPIFCNTAVQILCMKLILLAAL